MSNQDSFLPFNFCTVSSFDALSVALAELPIPQRSEPSGPFSEPVMDSELGPLSSSVQAEMLELFTETARNRYVAKSLFVSLAFVP